MRNSKQCTLDNEFVPITRLAKWLGMDYSQARRYVLELGYVPRRRYIADPVDQLTLCVTQAEAEEIASQRASETPVRSIAPVSEAGIFYVIQMVPKLDPNFLKLGFAESLEQRIAQYQITTPFARALRTWPCKRSWEQAAIDTLTRVGCRLVINKVFECNDPGMLLERGDVFFSMLPPPYLRVPIAKVSPLNELLSVESCTTTQPPTNC